MENLDNIRPYAIILIYPDGFIETTKTDERQFHMEYFLDLKRRSNRFQEIIKRKGIYIPDDNSSAKLLLTYDVDAKLAEDGIIVIHSLFLDEEIRMELEDISKDYYVSLPNDLTQQQKQIMSHIILNNDMASSWFSTFENNDPIELSYDELKSIINDKNK